MSDDKNESIRLNYTIGEALLIMRRRHGLSQSELAKRAGVAQRTVAKTESGDRSISLGAITALFVALGHDILFALRERKDGDA